MRRLLLQFGLKLCGASKADHRNSTNTNDVVDWLEAARPTNTSEIRIRFRLQGTNEESWEEFNPSAMTLVQMIHLYDRLLDDQDPEKDTLYQFSVGLPEVKEPPVKAHAPVGAVDYTVPRRGGAVHTPTSPTSHHSRHIPSPEARPSPASRPPSVHSSHLSSPPASTDGEAEKRREVDSLKRKKDKATKKSKALVAEPMDEDDEDNEGELKAPAKKGKGKGKKGKDAGDSVEKQAEANEGDIQEEWQQKAKKRGRPKKVDNGTSKKRKDTDTGPPTRPSAKKAKLVAPAEAAVRRSTRSSAPAPPPPVMSGYQDGHYFYYSVRCCAWAAERTEANTVLYSASQTRVVPPTATPESLMVDK